MRGATNPALVARCRSGVPGDRLLLVVVLGLAVAGRGADPRGRDGSGAAAEAVEADAPLGRGHGAAVRRGGRLLTLGPRRRRGRLHPCRYHGGLRVGRRPPRRGPERDPRRERPRDERRPPVRPPEPRAPGAGAGAAFPVPPRRPRAAQALLARRDHLPAHVLRQPQRESLEVAVEARREGVARGVRPRDERRRRRPPRPRPHRAALAPDPLQLHRLLPPRFLLVLGALVGHADDHLIRGLVLRGHLAGAVRLGRRELLTGVEVAPADGAGDVAGEPLPDAVRVEGVAAPGQQPELLVALELAEADRALERGVLAPDPELLGLRVPHRRERREHGGVEPALLLVPLLLPRQREQRGGRDGRPVRGGAPPAPAHVHGEEADEEEGRDERHQEHDHGRAEARRLVLHAEPSSSAAVVLVPRRRLRRGGPGEHQQQSKRGEQRRRRRMVAGRRHLAVAGGPAGCASWTESLARGARRCI
ncbi:hypothetical protein PAHAL_4G255300 [Panicum hallii]|jgi:hypothetical protein|uniref:Uncharacterized protein n=1 Tax=Panicum hallii TaxID=206008 RepID=A0A2T8JDW7_9POAL|nr:hypothetical protein PAHAL_4G255300 [Panicum hallii]